MLLERLGTTLPTGEQADGLGHGIDHPRVVWLRERSAKFAIIDALRYDA
jgi:hypothetical protein